MQHNDADNIFDCLKKNNVNDEIIKSSVEKLSPEQQKSLGDIISNRALMQSIFESPRAKEIMKKLQEK